MFIKELQTENRIIQFYSSYNVNVNEFCYLLGYKYYKEDIYLLDDFPLKNNYKFKFKKINDNESKIKILINKLEDNKLFILNSLFKSKNRINNRNLKSIQRVLEYKNSKIFIISEMRDNLFSERRKTRCYKELKTDRFLITKFNKNYFCYKDYNNKLISVARLDGNGIKFITKGDY